jgi:hypothetical protein
MVGSAITASLSYTLRTIFNNFSVPHLDIKKEISLFYLVQYHVYLRANLYDRYHFLSIAVSDLCNSVVCLVVAGSTGLSSPARTALDMCRR